MEINVSKDSNNPVIGRREIWFSITQEDRTPSKDDAKKELCKKLNLSPESTIIVRLDQEFGTRMSRALAHSYPSAEALKKFEQEHLFEREVKKAKKAAAAGSGEAVQAAAPETKEEKKEGEKEEEKEEAKQ